MFRLFAPQSAAGRYCEGMPFRMRCEFQPYLHPSSNNCSGAGQSSAPQASPLTHTDARQGKRQGATGSLNTGCSRPAETLDRRLMRERSASGGHWLARLLAWCCQKVSIPPSQTSRSFVLVNVLEWARKWQPHPNAARPAASALYRSETRASLALEPQDLWGTLSEFKIPISTTCFPLDQKLD